METFGEPGPFDAVVFLQTIEHVQDPVAVLGHFRELLAPGGVAYVSTPNLLTLAPAGAEKSDNPWHLKEYRARGVRRPVPRRCSARSSCWGCFTPASCGCTGWRCGLGWDRVHRRARGHQARSMTGSRRRSPAATSRCDPSDLDSALDFLAVCRV